MRVLGEFAPRTLSFRRTTKFICNAAFMAGSFDAADNKARGRPGRAADSSLDDLAHPADTAHHGRHRIILYGALGSFRRRDLGRQILALTGLPF